MNQMIMWLGITILTLAFFVVSVIYLVKRINKFWIVKKIRRDKKWLGNLIGLMFLVFVFVISSIAFSIINAFLVMIHLCVIWIICDLIMTIVNKRIKQIPKVYIAGIVAIVVTTAYLAVGYYTNANIVETHYDIETEKKVGHFRVVLISDLHVGTTFNGKELEKYVERINETRPDAVIIAGDYIDDSTAYQEMVDACSALGKLKPNYLTLYVFGNHDKGYYGNEVRGYGEKELREELLKNSVKILEDDSAELGGLFHIYGRIDRSEEEREGRASMEELLKDVNTNQYNIVVDHQPHDYDTQADSEADLVLSGHTHGGQLFPINFVGEWTKENHATYGRKTINSTDFIVTSGMSDWEILFKTGCKSEYVVIDINGQNVENNLKS